MKTRKPAVTDAKQRPGFQRGKSSPLLHFWFYSFQILSLLLLASASEAIKTRKPYHLAWDPSLGEVSYYTVYQYRSLTDDYLAVATVLFPAPPQWTIPVGTLKGTIWAVTVTDTSGFESLRSEDCPLLKLPK